MQFRRTFYTQNYSGQGRNVNRWQAEYIQQENVCSLSTNSAKAGAVTPSGE